MKNALDFFGTNDLFSFSNEWFNSFPPFLGISKSFIDSPKVNIKETDKAYEIEIANPGFGKDETNIKIENGVLYVNMTSESKEGENDDKKYHVKQWSKSSYSESWKLPENVIEDQISAKHDNGVLVITLPKDKEYKNKVKTISIN